MSLSNSQGKASTRIWSLTWTYRGRGGHKVLLSP
ncbi:hypothetical protein E2C01_040692 [Portunus trituberculatus]|uniref:Uncharacterized protein n=1 Tax=Portunus trituberculatus TaxID=210409 RepID=A0A5B7FHC4_PORTR|nr:hypothetical protein [Portunus trituberculatus]